MPSTETSIPTIFASLADALRAGRATSRARRQLRSELRTLNTPTVRLELQAIEYGYPSELVDDAVGR